jgi:hypothetical protein
MQSGANDCVSDSDTKPAAIGRFFSFRNSSLFFNVYNTLSLHGNSSHHIAAGPGGVRGRGYGYSKAAGSAQEASNTEERKTGRRIVDMDSTSTSDSTIKNNHLEKSPSQTSTSTLNSTLSLVKSKPVGAHDHLSFSETSLNTGHQEGGLVISKPTTLWAMMRDPHIAFICVLYTFFSFSIMFVDEVFPLWCVSSTVRGGLGWSSAQVTSIQNFIFHCSDYVLPAAIYFEAASD